MSNSGFEAAVIGGDGGPVIVLRGTVNKAAREMLEAAYEEAAGRDGEIRLDFREVEYINSTGIALIVGLLARARAVGKAMGAFGLTEHYREVFEITRLSDFMTIYDNATVTD